MGIKSLYLSAFCTLLSGCLGKGLDMSNESYFSRGRPVRPTWIQGLRLVHSADSALRSYGHSNENGPSYFNIPLSQLYAPTIWPSSQISYFSGTYGGSVLGIDYDFYGEFHQPTNESWSIGAYQLIGRSQLHNMNLDALPQNPLGGMSEFHIFLVVGVSNASAGSRLFELNNSASDCASGGGMCIRVAATSPTSNISNSTNMEIGIPAYVTTVPSSFPLSTHVLILEIVADWSGPTNADNYIRMYSEGQLVAATNGVGFPSRPMTNFRDILIGGFNNQAADRLTFVDLMIFDRSLETSDAQQVRDYYYTLFGEHQ